MKLLRLVPIVGLLFLAGCSGTNPLIEFKDRVSNAYSVLTEAKVSREAVVLARTTFDAAEVTATNYLRLQRCTPMNRPVCREAKYTQPIEVWILKGRDARNRLTLFMKQHPNELGPKGVYDALVEATRGIRSIVGDQ